MEYAVLNDGSRMPVFGLGTWDLRGEACTETIIQAINIGYRLIDTAQMYRNEKEVGKGIRASGISRDELFITSKVISPDRSYDAVIKAVDRSLEALGLDCIDLYLLHEPYDTAQEMYAALKQAQQEGKVRSIGISNFHEERYSAFVKDCGIIPAVNQVESHVYFMQKDLQKLMSGYRTVMQGWAPFTEGRRKIFADPVLKRIAEKHHKTAAQIALRSLLDNGICTVAKSSKADRLKENLDIFDFRLTEEELREIAALDEHRSLFGWY
ncbi:MAG: aldo/keto reductase [Solobacterium sp.]|nr:aldo/keto reductase [Solobacterium sp.]